MIFRYFSLFALIFVIFPLPSYAQNTAATTISPPTLLAPVLPVYPAALTRYAAPPTGTVLLLLTLDEAGAVAALSPITWTAKAFVEAATVAINGAKFAPARLSDGTAVAVEIQIEVAFAPPPPPPPPPGGEILGQVVARGSRFPVAGAALTVQGTTAETTSGPDGRFVLSWVPAGKHVIRILAADFEPLVAHEEIGEGERLEIRYFLEPQFYGGLKLTVTGQRKRQEVSRQTVTRREVLAIPGIAQDPIRVVQVLAGVATPNDLSGSLLVRGSDNRDNFFEIDGVAVPFIYHVGGFSSVFSGYLIDSVDFYPSNFGARYGDAIGGAIRVTTREPEDRIWRGAVSIGSLWSEAYIEGPITDSVSFYLAGRRSYFDFLLKQFLPTSTGVSFLTAPRFGDYQGKIVWRPGGGHSLSLSVFGAKDTLGLLLDKEQLVDPNQFRDFGFENEFHTVRLGDLWRGKGGLRNEAMVSGQLYRFFFKIGEQDNIEVRNQPIRFRDDLSVPLPVSATIKAGAWLDLLPAEINAVLPRPPRPGEYDYDFETAQRIKTRNKFRAWQADAYVSWEQQLGPVVVETGVHSNYNSLFPFWLVDPRLQVRWQVNKRWMLKGAAGVYHQFPDAQFALPEAGGNPARLPPGAERSMHYLTGTEFQPGWNMTLIAEGYYKDMDKLIWQTGDPFDPVRYRNTGSGRAWGAEFTVRKPLTDRVFGWISYSYSVSQRRTPQAPEWELAEFDQPHIINAVLSWQISKKWKLGARWRYSSGSPAHGVDKVIFYSDRTRYLPIRSAQADHRLAAYQRLDLRVDRDWVFQQWSLTSFLEIMNAYLHDNPLQEVYSYDYSQVEAINSFPLLPYFGIRAQF